MSNSIDKLFYKLIIKYFWALAIIGILIASFTWYLDLSGFVNPCAYCRVQRTMIGVVSIVMLLPIRSYLTAILQRFLGVLFVFVGASISVAQMFLAIHDGTFPTYNSWLAMGALVFLFMQLFTIFIRTSSFSNHLAQ
jgi:disulfide bond formation protein DsbB